MCGSKAREERQGKTKVRVVLVRRRARVTGGGERMATETPEVQLARIEERLKALADRVDEYQAASKEDVGWIKRQIKDWGERLYQAEMLTRRVDRVENWTRVTAVAVALEVLGLVLIVLFR